MELNKIFTSNMVFACGKPIRIYGSGCGRAEVSFAGMTKTVVSEGNEWITELPPMEYGGPYELAFDDGSKRVTLGNIYVGEVYLFAGQSNMEFKLKSSSSGCQVYESIEGLRLFSTDTVRGSDRFSSRDGWVQAEKDGVGEWSAIGYLTGREIAKRKGVAIGVITCYQGASIIESWVPAGTFKDRGIEIPAEKLSGDHFYGEYEAWNSEGVLYSSVLSQVIPFSLSAVVWYQGESDDSLEEAKVYLQELSAMIEVWRNAFMDDELPFAVIQIADCLERMGEAWSTIQKAQYDVQSAVPRVKCVISRDVCENDNIHPPTKDKLSMRVATALGELVL